jgi:hypothetical protein
MIMISGVWNTTQSESITSPHNNDKVPSTNMHTSLKQYPGFDLPQTMRGMMSNLEMEIVLMLGMMKMVMKMLFPMPRRSHGDDGGNFLTGGSNIIALLEVEEGVCLYHRLRKLWENRA